MIFNYVYLIGRFKALTKEENNDILLTLEVPREELNKDKIYERDLLKCVLPPAKADVVKEYCEIDSIVGIRGKLQSKNEQMFVLVEKLAFMSSNSKLQKRGFDEKNYY